MGREMDEWGNECTEGWVGGGSEGSRPQCRVT